jgi:sulfur-oxidizing protein SoxY
MKMSQDPIYNISYGRRDFLALAGAGMVAAVAGAIFPGKVFASTDEAAAMIAKITGGANAEQGKVTFVLPAIAENGNTVPVTVTVDHPMSDSSYIDTIHLIADQNPAPEVADFHLTPGTGVAQVSIRMRLAQTQNIVAVARSNSGKFYLAEQEIKVTIGGCGG